MRPVRFKPGTQSVSVQELREISHAMLCSALSPKALEFKQHDLMGSHGYLATAWTGSSSVHVSDTR